MVVLSALTVWCAQSVAYLPTSDGPQHVFLGHLENHYGDPGTIYSSLLVPSWGLAYRGFSALFVPLEGLLGWREALRLCVSLMVTASAWGFAAMAMALDPRRRILAFAGFPLAWSWHFYMGFFSFVIATAIGFAILAYVLKRPSFSSRDRWYVAVALLVQAVAHVFAACLTGLLIVLILVMRRQREIFREVALSALMGLPAMAVFAACVAFRGTPFNTEFVSGGWRERFSELPRLIVSGPSWRAVGWLLIVLGGISFGVRRIRRGGGSDERALAIGAVLLLAIGCCSPRDIAGWQFFAPRFLPLATSLAVVLYPIEAIAAPAWTTLVRTLAFVVPAGSLAMTQSFHRRLAADCGDAIAGLSAPIRRTGVQFAVALDMYCGVSRNPETSEVPFMAPLRHIGALYTTVQGGAVPYLFVGNFMTHAFMPRNRSVLPMPPIPPSNVWNTLDSDAFIHDARARREFNTVLAAHGMQYEGVIVTGAGSEDIADWKRQGYVADWENSSVLLGHFQPCALDLSVPLEDAKRNPQIEVGISGNTNPIGGVRVSGTRADAQGRAHLEIRPAPCGSVWVRVRWILPGQRTVFCKNAASGGEIAAEIDHARGSMECAGADL